LAKRVERLGGKTTSKTHILRLQVAVVQAGIHVELLLPENYVTV
jgi:hypothetical protein